MAEHDRADVRTVPFRTLLGELGLWLITAGHRYFREHPDELASETDELALIAAGCRYVRDHPEALREPFPFTPGGQRDG